MHWPDPDQRHRIEEIRDNLIARIAEAEHEGWLGEVEGLQTSLASANDKLAQIDRHSGAGSVDLPAPVLRSAGSTYTDTGRSELASRFREWVCPSLDQINGECC